MTASTSHAVHLSTKPLSESQSTDIKPPEAAVALASAINARFHRIDQSCPTEVVWCRGCILDGSVVLTGSENSCCSFTR